LESVGASRFERWLSRIYRLADVVLVLSRDLARKLEFHGFSRVNVVYNGVPRDLGNVDMEAKDFSSCKVLYLSHLMEQKGIADVLRVAETRCRDISFSIAGDGEEKLVRRVREAAEQCGNITYHGRIEGAQKAALLAESTVFVLPTYYEAEGVPLSLLEAMASGMAVVVTRHNGIPEIVGDHGNYVEAKNPASLGDALVRLSDDSHLVRRQARALQQLSQQYSEEKFLDQVKARLIGNMDRQL
jgi:glycosyltransferase involved in cell wall biosynthesis